jgi:Domain of unknown function (DUF4937
MLIKRIICRVREDQKESFSKYQQQWNRLSSVKGFIGQFGGWKNGQPLTACVYAFWETRKDYDRFMEKVHDVIFLNSGQGSTYSSIDVRLYDGNELGVMEEMSDLIESQYIRVSLGQVQQDKKLNFVKKQEEIWNPGMTAADGMMGGVYAFSLEEEDRFIVLTG